MSWPFGVGRVAEQEQHSLVTDLAKAGHVGRKAIWRVVIELEVARVHNLSDRRIDRQRDRVGDGVTHRHRLHPERPELHRIADPNLAQVGFAKEPMLFQLGLDETQRQPRPVDGNVDLLQRVRQTADMVLVAVREEDPKHFTVAAQQVGDVGQHKVDARHVLVREHESGVDDKDLVVPLEGPHVDSDLAQAAQRDIPESRRTHSRRSCSASCFGGSTGTGGGGGASSLARYAFTRSKSCSRSAISEPLCSAAAGWYSGTYATSPRITRVPWIREIDPWPGMRRSSAWRPRMRTTLGRNSSSCRLRYGEHASASLGIGSRFIGGRHLSTFVMYTSDRLSPIRDSRVSSSLPAAPTNGSPCRSSLKPGASPTIRMAGGQGPHPGAG